MNYMFNYMKIWHIHHLASTGLIDANADFTRWDWMQPRQDVPVAYGLTGTGRPSKVSTGLTVTAVLSCCRYSYETSSYGYALTNSFTAFSVMLWNVFTCDID